MRPPFDDAARLANIGRLQARTGHPIESQQAFEKAETIARTTGGSAAYFAGLGRPDEAFAWLEKAYRDRWMWLTFLRSEWDYDSLRGDPRYADLAHRVGIPESAPTHP